MFSGAMVPIALGLDVVASLGGSFVTCGAGMYVDWSPRDRNSTSWPGFSCVMALMLWALSKYCF